MTDHYRDMILRRIEAMQLELDRIYDLVKHAPSNRETIEVSKHETNGHVVSGAHVEKSMSLSERDFVQRAVDLSQVVSDFVSQLSEDETFTTSEIREKMNLEKQHMANLTMYLQKYINSGKVIRKEKGRPGVCAVYQRVGLVESEN